MSSTYAPLPFSYLTGGATDKSPGFKKSTSEENNLDGIPAENQDPYSIFAGQTPAPLVTQTRPINNRQSLDITDPKLDVTDPYLLSTGRLSGNKAVVAADPDSYNDDPRYRDSVPSESDGGNVFFRPNEQNDRVFTESHKPNSDKSRNHLKPTEDNYPTASLPRTEVYTNSGPAPINRTEAYTNPNIGQITRDEDDSSQSGKKLPRYRVGESGVYQYYTGPGPEEGQQVQAPPSKLDKPMESANNPIWNKYYAGNSPPGVNSDPANTTGSPGSPGIRPVTQTEDFNTLLRNSQSDYNKGCCHTKTCAVMTAIIITAIICLGAGFAGGWFIYQTLNPVVMATTTTTTTVSVPGASASLTEAPGGGDATTPNPAITTPRTVPTTTTTTTASTPSPAATPTTSTGAPGGSTSDMTTP